jgi:sporadic carbohydrate cluster 2OG-Fe(II) oxygenase
MIYNNFETQDERSLKLQFLTHGFIKFKIENLDGLHAIRDLIINTTAQHLDIKNPDPKIFLGQVHTSTTPEQLNNLRLTIINNIRSTSWFRPTYLSLARNIINKIVGNELVMQRSLGLSVQLPKDGSSLLPTHSDVWSGDSKFESVFWLPLVDCFKTKSMYIVDPIFNERFQKDLVKHQGKSSEEIYELIKKHCNFLDVEYGSGIIFNQNLMHGNRINNEKETRWSMNCRFKNMMSPYGDKRLGEFFEPITIRAQTQAAIDYQLPEGFEE